MTGKWKDKKVAVLLGGVSKEREISLRTGAAITEGLKRKGYNAVSIDCGLGYDLVLDIQKVKPDVAVIALHGKYGEDGCVQGLLECLKIPYSGGGVLASSIGMDKVVCSRIAKNLNIRCPNEVVADLNFSKPRELANELKIPLPVIVKPSREGSTVNMTIVKKESELANALEIARGSDTKIIIQEYIAGKEVTVGVINGRVMPVVEVAPRSGFYDYKSKYTKGMTEYIVPARIDEKVAGEIQKWTKMIYTEIDCDGTARADYIVSPDGKSYFLEINTIPGMTELSLVPKAAANMGMSFDDLCEELLEGAKLKNL